MTQGRPLILCLLALVSTAATHLVGDPDLHKRSHDDPDLTKKSQDDLDLNEKSRHDVIAEVEELKERIEADVVRDIDVTFIDNLLTTYGDRFDLQSSQKRELKSNNFYFSHRNLKSYDRSQLMIVIDAILAKLKESEGQSHGSCSGSNNFRCPSGGCIKASAVCDGAVDCPDGEDERHCVSPCQGLYSWQCPSGECISEAWVCDGHADCHDGADESVSTCNLLITTRRPITTRGPITTIRPITTSRPITTCRPSVCDLPTPCHGGATCVVDSDDSRGFTCVCPPGYFGKLCQFGTQEANTKCGELPLVNPFTSRIVGGEKTFPNQWPSICSVQSPIRTWAPSPKGHFCGGTLVKNVAGRFYLISAAHCLWKCPKEEYWNKEKQQCRVFEDRPMLPSDLKVVCGVHNVKKTDTPDYSKTFKVVRYQNHENFNVYDPSPQSDITVIELEDQPIENNYIQAACLPERGHREDERAIVAGWGVLNATIYPPAYAEVLHHVNKPIDSDEYCEAKYHLDTDKHNNFCAGHRGGGKDSCYGDSGGPLYTRRHGRWTLTGVVSYGNGCADDVYIGVYADVFQLRDWIFSKINNY